MATVRNVTLTIADGQTESEELNLQEHGARRKLDLGFFIPNHGVATVKPHFATVTGGTYKALNDGFGNDYVLVADKSQVLYGIPFGAMKLVASAAVTGNQAFVIQVISATGVEGR